MFACFLFSFFPFCILWVIAASAARKVEERNELIILAAFALLMAWGPWPFVIWLDARPTEYPVLEVLTLICGGLGTMLALAAIILAHIRPAREWVGELNVQNVADTKPNCGVVEAKE